jgi:hypothetical protein
MLIATMLVLLAPVAAASPPDAKPVCQEMAMKRVERTGKPLGAHPLTAEPNAKQILTVLRTVDGCTKPVVVREDIGPKQR